MTSRRSSLLCALCLLACRDEAYTSESSFYSMARAQAERRTDGTAAAPAHARTTAESVEDLEVAFKSSIARVSPAVVSIYSTKTIDPRDAHVPFFFFPPMSPFEQRGLGSGVIFDHSGHVLTNSHVVAEADEIKVELADGRETDARVVGIDPHSDIAVLEIDRKDVAPVELGDSDAMEVGDWVLAIGSPFGLPLTVSAGIVSAKGRAEMGLLDYEDFIQTDAAVNPGSSGGPLVDVGGRVIAINTAIASASGGSVGVAFAVPIRMARRVAEELIASGRVVRGYIGVNVASLTEELAASFGYRGEGMLVHDVVEGGPAAKAGLRPGDIIVSLDGEKIDGTAGFRREISERPPRSRVVLGVWRDGAQRALEVTLGTLPTEKPHEREAEQPTERPSVGVALVDLDADLARRLGIEATEGVAIAEVAPGSPAAHAGVQPGDLLEQIGDRRVASAEQARRMLERVDLAKGIRTRIRRGEAGAFVFLRVPRRRAPAG
jgi:serine protease Do